MEVYQPMPTELTARQSTDSPLAYVGVADYSPTLPATYATYRLIRKQPTVAFVRAMSMAPIVASTWSFKAKDGVPDDWVKFIDEEI